MNRFDQKIKNSHTLRRICSSAVVFLAGIAALMYGLSSVSSSANASQADSLKQAITRSAVHCYAMEGRYPESLAYLQEHYGIKWDETRYTVDYEIFGANMIPTVTVIPLY